MCYRHWMHLAHFESPANYAYYGRSCSTTGTIGRDTKPEWEPFELETDPSEKNGQPGYAGVVKELQPELQRLRRQYGNTDACGAVREGS